LDKRYQVFLSSTYSDLEDERREVIQALLELDSIPTGMELFPAANADQWTLIKKYIDDCDYYIVIIAGRYGSIGPDGLSYTEMEYRYAVDSGKPVIAFLHDSPDSIQAGRSEPTEEGRTKLLEFRELAQKKMCKFWNSPSDLGSKVSRSLIQLIKNNPAIGWVRADQVSDSSATELLKLRTRIEELEQELIGLRTSGPTEANDLAQGNDSQSVEFTISVIKADHTVGGYKGAALLTWNEIFAAVAPRMIDRCRESDFEESLNELIQTKRRPAVIEQLAKELPGLRSLGGFKIDTGDFQTIKIQLRALGLIEMTNRARSAKDTETYWTLTPYGDHLLTKLRAIPKRAAGTTISSAVTSRTRDASGRRVNSKPQKKKT
jgi:hypothetical protein